MTVGNNTLDCLQQTINDPTDTAATAGSNRQPFDQNNNVDDVDMSPLPSVKSSNQLIETPQPNSATTVTANAPSLPTEQQQQQQPQAQHSTSSVATHGHPNLAYLKKNRSGPAKSGRNHAGAKYLASQYTPST